MQTSVVHLAVLMGRPAPTDTVAEEHEDDPRDENGLSRLWDDAPPADRATQLITAGVGRRRLSRELGVTEYQARQLLDRVRSNGTDPNGTEESG